VHETRAAHRRLQLREPVLDRRACGELGDRVRVAEHVRRLQVDEVRDREQGGVEAPALERDGERGLGVDHGVPRDDRVEPVEQGGRLRVDEVADGRIELAAAPFPKERPRALDAADAVRDLDELAELREPRREGDRLAGKFPGPALPVPHLVGRAERVEHVGRQLELLAERAGHRGVVVDHVVHVAVTGDEERQPDPEPLERRAPGADQAHTGGRRARAAKLVFVLRGLQRDVVAEPLRLLVRVGVAPDVDEQRGVVDDRPRLVVEAEPLGDAQRDQGLAQHVLHRLPEAQVDPERERRDELGQPDGRCVSLARRA
jgi:hypothetical protein